MKYIYCFTNKINNKQYIGSTINDPTVRYKQHIYNAQNKNNIIRYNYPLYQAFRKYGLDNFTFEILEELNCSYKELLEIEHNYIIKYNCLSPNGYNQTTDTEHPLNDPETYKKVSKTKRNLAKEIVEIDSNNNIINK